MLIIIINIIVFIVVVIYNIIAIIVTIVIMNWRLRKPRLLTQHYADSFSLAHFYFFQEIWRQETSIPFSH